MEWGIGVVPRVIGRLRATIGVIQRVICVMFSGAS
jgi:hypothetical protein